MSAQMPRMPVTVLQHVGGGRGAPAVRLIPANLVLFTSVLPVVAAWMLVDTLDWYPYLVHR